MTVSNIYIGAFALCKLHKGNAVIEKIRNVVACMAPRCVFYKKDYKTIQLLTVASPKFCSRCGQKLGSYDEPYLVPKFYTNDICNLINDRLRSIDINISEKDNDFEKNIFIPNEYKINFKLFQSRDEEFIPIDTIRIIDEKIAFENEFESDIEILKSNYDDVIIDWGVINYYE